MNGQEYFRSRARGRRSRGRFRNCEIGGRRRGGYHYDRSESLRRNRYRYRSPRRNSTEDAVTLMDELGKEDSSTIAIILAQNPPLLRNYKRQVERNQQLADTFFSLLSKVFDSSSARSFQKEVAILLEKEEVLEFGIRYLYDLELNKKQICMVNILKTMVKISRLISGRHHFLNKVVALMDETDCISCSAYDQEAKTSISIQLKILETILSEQCEQDFTMKSIAPTMYDIENNPLPVLQKNIVHGPFESSFHYLETHFNLLREDFINPIREGIQHVRKYKPHEKETNTYVKVKDVRVYFGLSISCPVFEDGLNYVLSLRTRFNRRRTNDSFLKFGTLVVLSADNFKTYFFGTVSNNGKLNDGQIHVNVLDLSLEGIWQIFHLPITMIEPINGYFESYRHVLSVLQKLSQLDSDGKLLPFQKYIVDCSKIVQQPCYLKPTTKYYLKHDGDITPRKQRLSPVFQRNNHDSESSSICWEDNCGEYGNGDQTTVLENDWPLPEKLEMDKSQMLAFKTALTKEFSLIQGPPGCGKTYVGLRIAKTLLQNQNQWTGTMMVVCYTNHALDQFLEGILKFTNSIVRFGSRSRNEALEQCNIKNKRRQVNHLKRLKSNAWRKKTQLQNNLNVQYRKLKCMKEMILHEDILKDEMGDIYAQFKWRQRDIIPVISIWLGVESAHVVSPDYFQMDNFGDETEIENINGNNDTHKIRSRIRIKLQDNFCEINTFVCNVEDVFRLSDDRRWQLYCRWVHSLCQKKVKHMDVKATEFNEACKQLNEINMLIDTSVINNSKVIGFTTTGAAKYWDILQDVQPTIVIVEEAAEVFESHAVASLSTGCKHLILIGDHQQLRPSPVTHILAHEYKLEISLFERMVKNKMDCVTLNIQHRMRPEIAENLRTSFFYPKLRDAKIVYQYGNTLGIQGNMFFVDHTYLEHEARDSMSKVNTHEAEFLVALCKYLLQQGYSDSDITILTLYKGQVTKIRALVREQLNNSRNIRVDDVDNFQGEESEIVLLSFVRSNNEGRIGFVGRRNRICVALSRAKKGLYMIGNTEALCKRNHREWSSIITRMKKLKMVGESLTLVCQRHPETKHNVKSAHDFKCVPEGGCQRKCNAQLPCGHVCIRNCHPTDLDHETYICQEPCLKTCENGHGCHRKCFETCTACTEVIIVTLPKCKHTLVINCSDSIENVMCSVRCHKRLPCNHICNKECSKPCEPCIITTSVSNDQCGHVNDVPCFLRNSKTCFYKCKKLLACGHECEKICSDECEPCLTTVQYTRTDCGHLDEKKCHENAEDAKQCSNECGLRMDCFHSCIGICGDMKSSSTCKDSTNKLSFCSKGHAIGCNVPCDILLPCGHRCNGHCNTCTKGRFHRKCTTLCNTLLPCGHTCSAYCRQCMPCRETRIRKCPHSKLKQEQNCNENVLCLEQCIWQCEHKKCEQKCGMICDRERCNEPCLKTLPCGHECIGMCGDPCPKACFVCDSEAFKDIKGNRRFVQLLDCGDIISVQYMDEYMDAPIRTFGLKKCPLCSTPILNTHGNRYERRINEVISISQKGIDLCLHETRTDVLLRNFLESDTLCDNESLLNSSRHYSRRKEYIMSANIALTNKCISKIINEIAQIPWLKDYPVFQLSDVTGIEQELQRYMDCHVLTHCLINMSADKIERHQEKLNHAADILDAPGPYDLKTRSAFTSFVSTDLNLLHSLPVVQLKIQEIAFNDAEDEIQTTTNVLEQETVKNEDGIHIITLLTLVGPVHCDEGEVTPLPHPEQVGVSIKALDEHRSKKLPQQREETKASKLVRSPEYRSTAADKRANKRIAEDSTRAPRVQNKRMKFPDTAGKDNNDVQPVVKQKNKRFSSEQCDQEAKRKRPRLDPVESINVRIDRHDITQRSSHDVRKKHWHRTQPKTTSHNPTESSVRTDDPSLGSNACTKKTQGFDKPYIEDKHIAQTNECNTDMWVYDDGFYEVLDSLESDDVNDDNDMKSVNNFDIRKKNSTSELELSTIDKISTKRSATSVSRNSETIYSRETTIVAVGNVSEEACVKHDDDIEEGEITIEEPIGKPDYATVEPLEELEEGEIVSDDDL